MGLFLKLFFIKNNCFLLRRLPHGAPV